MLEKPKELGDGNLIDLAIKEAYAKRPLGVAPGYRDLLWKARKFILDESMSGHLADLTNAPFVQHDRLFAKQIADGARRMARLPHPVTWIEYDCRARKIRTEAEYTKVGIGTVRADIGLPMYPETNIFGTSSGVGLDVDEIIPRVGWLLQQHENLPSAYRMTEFALVGETKGDGNGRCVAMPMSYTWVADDATVLPWRDIPLNTEGRGARHPSEIASGVLDYIVPHVGISFPPFIIGKPSNEILRSMLMETFGELRAVWTLLATLNDLPVIFDAVRPSRGHMVRGNYKRFVEHSVIKLVVPAHRSLQTLAVRALLAVRRRAHEVRGHWRNDWRHPRTPGCEHDWINHNEHTLACRHCAGRRVWIVPHQRGDASLGIVTHNYSVERKEDA